ncbi:hypothetical protein TRICI_002418 [Trichomonascus ciferrii]|uniref:Major facilitator superfamily (MFS) profile domain-containing protein n=1 Tax=Trichomonascus ciferrii TaxID=44093 RepID=A0A642V5X3_9ASCO|nr:hypothetical protein TRICI_002418 [Trichomonascus ciferrii]
MQPDNPEITTEPQLDVSPKQTRQDGFLNSRPTKMLFLYVVIVAFSHFMMGYDFGYVSQLLVWGDFDSSELGERMFSTGDMTLITAAMPLGAFCGSLITWILADSFGRKYVSIGGNLLMIAGGGIQCGAHTMWTLVGGRFVLGWGVGIGSVMAPLLITELSPPKYRGQMVMFVNLVRNFFEMLSFAIGLSFEESVGGFRVHIGVALAFIIVQTVALLFIPESPRYLVQKGRTERAQKVFSLTHEGVTAEEIEAKVVELMNVRKTSPFDKIRGIHSVSSNFKALCLICLLQAVNQFTGMDAILYYNDEYFGSGGWTQWSVITCLTGSMGIIVAIPAYFLIDRMGRRFLLIISLIGCILMLIINAAAASQTTFHIGNSGTRYSYETNYKALRAMVTGTILYSAFYHFGLGIVPWMQSETLPMSVRALGSSIACAVHWIGSFTMTAAFFKMAKNMTPPGMYGFFIAVAFIGLVLLFLFYPELANRDLETIPPMLANGINMKQNIKLSNLTRKPA